MRFHRGFITFPLGPHSNVVSNAPGAGQVWRPIPHGVLRWQQRRPHSWFDLKRDTVVPCPEQRAKVKQMAAEVRDLSPLIISAEPTPRFRAAPAHWLHWTTRRVGRTVYLIAVNDDRIAHRATFELRRGPKRVRLAGAGAEAAVHGTRLEAEFDRCGVNIYQLEF